MAVLVREAAAVSFAQKQAWRQHELTDSRLANSVPFAPQVWRRLELTDSELAVLFYFLSSCCIPRKANLNRAFANVILVAADSRHGHHSQDANYNQTQVDQAICHNIYHTVGENTPT